jgi:hypothetical protein
MPAVSRLLALSIALAACTPRVTVEAAPDLDGIAHRYVILALQLGQHDANYVDAYYGPDSLKSLAGKDSLSLTAIRVRADSLLAALGTPPAVETDSLLVMRHRYLATQLRSMVAHTRRLGGERMTFDEEARAIYDATPPHFSVAYFDSLLTELELLLPGSEPLAERYQAFRDKLMIPTAMVDTVFRTALNACRARTRTFLPLPESERFTIEYVTGTSWNAYNWYQGNYNSLIQVNTDFPVPVDRAVDLACHEGYPGHHVYNASLEQALVRGRGWVELSIYPLFSPQSLIAEGSANYGIDMAFPGAERTAYERDSLFPLAGLDTSLAERNARVRVVMERMNYARNEVARSYLDSLISADSASTLIQRWWLQSPEAAAKTLRFIDTYRSYVINYNLGRDMVAAYIERTGGSSPAQRWATFQELLASPRLPADLK